jgi:hypothetical protein
VGDRIADQAHPSQDQKYAEWRRAARQYQTAKQGAAHEDELVERLPKVRDGQHQATCV